MFHEMLPFEGPAGPCTDRAYVDLEASLHT